MRSLVVFLVASLALASVALILTSFNAEEQYELVSTTQKTAIKFPEKSQELLLKQPPLPVPWSPPDELFLFWNREYVGVPTSGDAVREVVKMGAIEGGEYRDRNFITSLEGQEFRDLTLTCCSVLLFPPLDHGFPIFEPRGRMEHRVSRFVANGNTMIFTGGLTAIQFINTVFKFNLAPVDNNYSPGPFLKQPSKLPKSVGALGDVLRQQGIEVTAIHKLSLPVGSTVFFASPHGTPFFAIKYCEVDNPKAGEPPIKVSPPNCPKWKKRGHPCECGNIVYLGYDWDDTSNEKWNAALRASLDLVIGTPQD